MSKEYWKPGNMLYPVPAVMVSCARPASAHDQNWKSPEIIAANRKKLNGMGINYLLNVGPDGLGRIPLASQKVLREAAKLYEK